MYSVTSLIYQKVSQLTIYTVKTTVAVYYYHFQMFQREQGLSDTQWEICEWKRAGATYHAIRDECARRGWKVPSDEGLTRCFMRTALGQYWVPDHEGGGEYYLSLADELKVVEEVRAGAEELACCPTSYVHNLIYNVKVERHARAVNFLRSLGCHRLADKVDLQPPEPNKDWLTNFCARNNLVIRSARPLEEARRRYGNRTAVADWFRRYEETISQYHPSLILNMDETGVASNGKFKVVTPAGMLPVCPMDRQGVHITGVVTFSSTGHVFTPGIILPKLQNLPTELAEFSGQAHFYTSENGWMTKDVFLSFCVNLAHEISLWRPTLPSDIRDKRMLLLLDGHPSRKCFAGIEYLRLNGVDVCTFPSHATHLMQPFDVLCASALKAHLRSSIARWNKKINTGWRPPSDSLIGAKRWVMVESFINAVQQTFTSRMTKEAFAKSGLWPLRAEVVLENPLITDEQAPENRDWVSSRCFSHPEDRWMLASQCGFNVQTPYGQFVRPLNSLDLVPSRPTLLTPIQPGLMEYRVIDFARTTG